MWPTFLAIVRLGQVGCASNVALVEVCPYVDKCFSFFFQFLVNVICV